MPTTAADSTSGTPSSAPEKEQTSEKKTAVSKPEAKSVQGAAALPHTALVATSVGPPKQAVPPGFGGPINEPSENDVMCGRGGLTNFHPGNRRFRTFVFRQKHAYLGTRNRAEKGRISREVVAMVRALDPPGRFIEKDLATDKWLEVGDEKARLKASQALREDGPIMREDAKVDYKGDDSPEQKKRKTG